MISANALIEKFQYALDNNWGYILNTAGVKWTASRQEAIEKTTDADLENARKYGKKWIGHTVSDCSGLFYWAFKQLGGYIYHGSNSIYDRYCSEKGKITDDIRSSMKPGTAVFVCKPSGNKSHIGLYVGNGKVIEAQGTIAGVCTSNLTASKWTYYGLLNDVDYGASDGQKQPSNPSSDKEPSRTLPTLKRGSKGEYVTLLQTKLIQKGYDLGKWGADGDFGSQTEKAVKEFQKDHGLTVDGIVGVKTWEAIDKASTNLYVVTIPHLPKFKAEALIKDYSGASMKEE